MKHEMKLHDAPFAMIRDGIKTIELRLCDEKRRAVHVGDEIKFVNASDRAQTVVCGVTALHVFPSFEELYESLPLLKCGYTEDDISTASPADMDAYYSREEQSAFGVVGIELKLL